MSVTYEGKEYHVHGPEVCPRPCSECPERHHHWLEAFDHDLVCDCDDCKAGRHPAALAGHEAWYQCKHCPAWVECEYVWALEEAQAEDDDEVTTCWCGAQGTYSELFDDAVFKSGSCGGLGTLYCECGGEFCVCHWHGDVECPGCKDCEPEDGDFDGQECRDYEDEGPL